MTIDVLSTAQLSAKHIAQWCKIQNSNPALSSPYFSPEFTLLTAAARQATSENTRGRHRGEGGEVRVAVLQAQGHIVGFFPFWRSRSWAGTIAGPVAGSLSDFQGLITAPDFELDPQNLLRQCGLDRWYFDHLLASQTSFKPFHRCVVPSAAIDLTAGYDQYMATRQTVSSSRFKDMARLRRKLAREVGPLRYEAHTDDVKVLAQLLAWKSQQFLRTGLEDLFELGWTRSLIQSIHTTHTENLTGMLSVLYAGDQLISAHMGMRSRDVWHYWLPSYDSRFQKFSPGLLLLLSMIEDAAKRGMHTFDLGKGSDSYKPLFSNQATLVAEGCAARPSWQWQLTQNTHQLKQTLRKAVRR
jgi:CelD/BcsL family acetyltransferase involved in cellulose biosynthesis